MAEGADVRSIDAIREWHAYLSEYSDVLAEALAGVSLEIRRAHDWVGEQLSRWQRAIREYEDDVTRAKAELSQRKFPNWDGREPDCTVQEKNLRIAKARLAHAEEQVATCRAWLTRLPRAIDELYTGPSRRLGNMLEADVPKGLALLSRRLASLEAYSGLRMDYSGAPLSSTPSLKGGEKPTASSGGGAASEASGVGAPPNDPEGSHS